MGYNDSVSPQEPHRESLPEGLGSASHKIKIPLREQTRATGRVLCLNREFDAAVANLRGHAKLQLCNAGIDPAVQIMLPYRMMGCTYAHFDGDFFTPHERMGSLVFVIATGYEIGRAHV